MMLVKNTTPLSEGGGQEKNVHMRATAAVPPFSLTERTVCSIPEAPCLGKCRTGHNFFTCQWRNGSFLPVKKWKGE